MNLYIIGSPHYQRKKTLLWFTVAESRKEALIKGRKVLEQYPLAFVNPDTLTATMSSISIFDTKVNCYLLIEESGLTNLTEKSLNDLIKANRIAMGDNLVNINTTRERKSSCAVGS